MNPSRILGDKTELMVDFIDSRYIRRQIIERSLTRPSRHVEDKSVRKIYSKDERRRHLRHFKTLGNRSWPLELCDIVEHQ